MNIQAYLRPDGVVGIRNKVVIIPASVCAAETSRKIAYQFEDAVAINNQHGCSQLGEDREITTRTLINIGKNPNFAAVLVIGLGCEGVSAEGAANKIAKDTEKSARYLIIQEHGGTLKTEEKGVEIIRGMIQEAQREKRRQADISGITLAIECGSSDATSGLASNPVAGYVSDKLISLGGTVIFSETTELIGAEHILVNRAVTKEVANKLKAVVKRCENKAKELGVDMRGGQPTPGNIKGGITTIEEKSLGCIKKGGNSPLEEVLEYGEIPAKKGLHFMDTPGQDIESITGMTAGGAQIVIFTTGRGTPAGSPAAPVVKITGNLDTYLKMKYNIDFNAGKVIAGKETIQEAGERLFELMIATINGRLTSSEKLGHQEFGIYKLNSTF